MENDLKPNEEENRDEAYAYPNLTEKELQRDLVNLHLPEIDLIGDGDFDKLEAELKARYGDDFFDGLEDDDEDSDIEEEEVSEEDKK